MLSVVVGTNFHMVVYMAWYQDSTARRVPLRKCYHKGLGFRV